jgi:hypothetical protein
LQLVYLGLAGILWTSAIWFNYQRILLRRPDEPVGRIYPLNVHGIVVYQTREERDWREEIQYSSIGLLALSALMAVWAKAGRPGSTVDLNYSHPLVLAILAASTRLLAPSLLIASER